MFKSPRTGRIKYATPSDINKILELAQEYGHLMNYMTEPDTIKARIHKQEFLVHTSHGESDSPEYIDGFYHIVPMRTDQDYNFVLTHKVFPPWILDIARVRDTGYHQVGIIMQGGCHRDVFKDLIGQAKFLYQELWCWCSIKSSKPDGYKELGFSFNPKVEYTFRNPNTDPIRESTYQLGRLAINDVDANWR